MLTNILPDMREGSHPPAPVVALKVGGAAKTVDGRSTSAPESVVLLDGGAQAYPRMLSAIDLARRSVHLEVYAFSPSGIGERFLEALGRAAKRGVEVNVTIDGWGSVQGGRVVVNALREAGCTANIHNRMRAMLRGALGRNHRKLLLVDDAVAFLGGINIGDENVGVLGRQGWADLALEIRGPQCALLGRRIRGQPDHPSPSSLRIYLCGLGGGWRLRRRYLTAFRRATRSIHLAHGYFLPDRGVVRALKAAARRGVDVRLLLAGHSDVPFARMAARSLYRQLLAAGVHIYEWEGSVLHAKVATVDGRRLLVGSFNLDPFSLANLETLVEVDDLLVVEQCGEWIQGHLARSTAVTCLSTSSRLRRWALDPLGWVLARVADAIGRTIAGRKLRRATGDPRDRGC